MNTNLHFHGDDLTPSSPEDGLFHVIPVPYEKTVSYTPGTGNGPQALLEASCQLELFDGKSVGALAGIHTTPFVDCQGSEDQALRAIAHAVRQCLALQKIPVVLGGEHTVTGAVVEALLERDEHFGVIQFDAHADLRDTYQGNPLSHACVMRRIDDLGVPIMQLGTRSYSQEEFLFRKQRGIPFLDAEDIFKYGIDQFELPADFPKKVFITFDIDALDPGLMPATGTPVPGGLGWYQAMWLLEKIMEERICLGFDLVEFSPIPFLPGAAFTGAQLVYAMMGYLTRSAKNRQFWQLP